MKVIILAGGLPSTIEADEKIPKPMAEIGERPILWHIMKYYASFGLTDFIICGGYKVDIIKEYFMNYYIHQSDITVDLETNLVTIHKKETENWKVSVVDTGIHANVSERIRRVKDYVGDDAFIVAYGDCVHNIDLNKMISQHKTDEKKATMAVARPSGRNQIWPITIKGFRPGVSLDEIKEDAWVNACCMIFNPDAFDYIEQHASLEHTLFHLGNENLLSTYCHEGFWMPMETIRDRDILNTMWNCGDAPWKNW